MFQLYQHFLRFLLEPLVDGEIPVGSKIASAKIRSENLVEKNGRWTWGVGCFGAFLDTRRAPSQNPQPEILISEVKMFLFNTKNWGWENSHTWIR